MGESVAIELPHLQADRRRSRLGADHRQQSRDDRDQRRWRAKGLRPIDPQRDLMPGATVTDAARAFEFHDDWSLALMATRYKLEEVKRTSIDRAFVRMVVTRSDQVAVQALYRLRSARQRIADQAARASIRAIPSENLDHAAAADQQPGGAAGEATPRVLHSADRPLARRGRAGRDCATRSTGDQSRLELPEFRR